MVIREPASHYKNTEQHVIDEETIIKKEHAGETACHHLAEATILKKEQHQKSDAALLTMVAYNQGIVLLDSY